MAVDVTALARRLAKRLGRRGATLLALATVDLVWGWLLVNPYLREQLTVAPSYRVIAHIPHAPPAAWGVAWLLVGGVCLAQAWTRNDRLAFGLAIVIKLLWAVFVLAAWLWRDAPLAWTGTIIWCALAAWVAIAAGWSEPPPRET